MTNAKEILIKARELLIAKGWTQEFVARSADGGEAHVDDADAVCFCSLGVIWRAWRDLCGGVDLLDADEVIAAMAENFLLTATSAITPPRTEAWPLAEAASTIAAWNDHPNRTYAEVIAAFDKAIELAE